MASVGHKTLLDQDAVAATTTSDGVDVEAHMVDMGMAVLAENHSTANFSIQAQHSIDGNTWVAIGSAVSVTGNGLQVEALPVPVLSRVRVVATRTGGTVDLDIKLVFDKRK